MAEAAYTKALDNTALDDVIACARQWLYECWTDHDLCRTTTSISDYPQRLIKLEHDEGDGVDLRLIPTNGARYEYCALSYCWGGQTDNFATTTEHNIQDRGNGFSSKDLPQTLQDAVVICRRLEILYLWVDSLCIAQGNLQDWQIQSANMDQVYGGALITLLAAASLHADNGLLLPRRQANGGSWRLRNPQGLASNPLSMITDPWLPFDNRTYATRCTKMFTRAWTLQEEIMSRRTLLWSQHGMIWLCPTRLRREWIEDECRADSGNVSKFRLPHFVDKRYAAFVHRSAGPIGTRIAWTDALTIYLPREITKSTDRLAAFAGLTQIATTRVSSRIIAGIWLDNLAEDLLWGGTYLSYQMAMQRAPSWTWASLPEECSANAWIGYEASSISKYACTLQDIQIDPPDAGISGPLRSGRLCLRSRKKRFPPRVERRWCPAVGPGFSCIEIHIAVDLDVSDHPDDDFWDNLECLKMLDICGRDFGLLLSPVDCLSASSQYRRVGRFEILSKVGEHALIHGPGLKGLQDFDFLRQDFKHTARYFEGCDECLVEIV